MKYTWSLWECPPLEGECWEVNNIYYLSKWRFRYNPILRQRETYIYVYMYMKYILLACTHNTHILRHPKRHSLQLSTLWYTICTLCAYLYSIPLTNKVCKTTIVGMDIEWLHLEAGLVCSWGHGISMHLQMMVTHPNWHKWPWYWWSWRCSWLWTAHWATYWRCCSWDWWWHSYWRWQASASHNPAPTACHSKCINRPSTSATWCHCEDHDSTEVALYFSCWLKFTFAWGQHQLFLERGYQNLDEEMEACKALFSSQEGAGEVDTGVPMLSMTAWCFVSYKLSILFSTYFEPQQSDETTYYKLKRG